MGISKRKVERVVKRIETVFSAGGMEFRGISSDLSARGLFIRTQHGFVSGTVVDITLHLPDGNASRLKGKVRRAIKTGLMSMKNGMGIEILEKDIYYDNYFKAQCGDDSDSDSFQKDVPPVRQYNIVPCPQCGVKNKVVTQEGANNSGLSDSARKPKCGKCGASLSI